MSSSLKPKLLKFKFKEDEIYCSKKCLNTFEKVLLKQERLNIKFLHVYFIFDASCILRYSPAYVAFRPMQIFFEMYVPRQKLLKTKQN